MMQERIHKIQGELVTQELDAALFMSPQNMYYLVGYTGSAGYLLIARNECTLIVDGRYTAQAKAECYFADVLEYTASNPFFKIIADLGYFRIGYEQNYLSQAMFSGLSRMMSFATWHPFQDTITRMRWIKDHEELNRIKTAASIADKSLMETLGIIKAGVTERSVAHYLYSRMIENGADLHPSFDIIVASGFRSAYSHGIATDKIIEKGDLVMLDFGCRYQYYHCDMTRTVVVGEPKEWQEEIYEHVLSAQMKVLNAMKAGMTNAQAHRLSNDYLYAAGYKECCGNTLGHGIGLDVEDGLILIDLIPFFGETKLQENMVVTVEPGIYLEGLGGVRIEDDVIIKQGGVEIITTSPKGLERV
jgi:Xaa-Pro aminopeptidase